MDDEQVFFSKYRDCYRVEAVVLVASHRRAGLGRLQPLRPTRGFVRLLTLLGAGFPTRISGGVRMRITAGFRANTQTKMKNTWF